MERKRFICLLFSNKKAPHRHFRDLQVGPPDADDVAVLAPAPWRKRRGPAKTAACVCTEPDGARPAGTPCAAIACND